MPDPQDGNKQTESISQSADENKGQCVYMRSLKKKELYFPLRRITNFQIIQEDLDQYQ